MDEPLAYLLTWTCYGTWLHGDSRGSVDRAHAVPGESTLGPDAVRESGAQGRLRGAQFALDTQGRAIVHAAIEEHARLSGWHLYALNVRTMHVHAVVASAGIPPERMLTSFKAWATRQLRAAMRVASGTRLWTRHGSTRYLWDEQSIARAVDYVVEGQDVPR